MASLSTNQGGLGIDAGKDGYEAVPPRNFLVDNALEMSILGSLASLAIACAPNVPRPLRLAVVATGVGLGANAYLIFQDEVNKPIGK
jgi:hypothetical protein